MVSTDDVVSRVMPVSAAKPVPREADAVVIGGGIVGCATAYELARRGMKVVLVEKGRIGDEQSNRAWGFVRQQRRDLAELPLMVAGNKIWPRLSAALEADIEWVQHGILTVAESEEQMAALRAWVDASHGYGVETQVLSRAQIAELIPEMGGPWIGGIYTPSDGHAEPVKATTALARGAAAAGAEIHTFCAAEDIEVAGGRVSAVVTERGAIKTPVVVCAAGAWSGRVARLVGLDLPQLVVRATVAETAPVPPLTRVACWTPGVAFRQRPTGSLYIARGGDSDYDLTLNSLRYARYFLPNYRKNWSAFRFHMTKDLWRGVRRALPGNGAPALHPFAHTVAVEPAPNPKVVRRAQGQLVRIFPALAGVAIQRTWAGMIDSTPDAVPVLGEVDRPRGFIFATGFSGHGFAMGPIVGQLMSELVVDGQPSIEIRQLDYNRFREGRMAAPKAIG